MTRRVYHRIVEAELKLCVAAQQLPGAGARNIGLHVLSKIAPWYLNEMRNELIIAREA
jgi:hypothetical protein